MILESIRPLSRQHNDRYCSAQGSTCISPKRRLVERRCDRSTAVQDHDPFTFRLNEIRAHDAGRRRWPVGERDRRLDELLTEEAQELAWGRCHLSIVYGEVTEEAEAQALDDVVCTILDALDDHWHRLTGVPNRYVTVTVGGPDAQQVVHALQAHLAPLVPKHWQIRDSAIVEVER